MKFFKCVNGNSPPSNQTNPIESSTTMDVDTHVSLGKSTKMLNRKSADSISSDQINGNFTAFNDSDSLMELTSRENGNHETKTTKKRHLSRVDSLKRMFTPKERRDETGKKIMGRLKTSLSDNIKGMTENISLDDKELLKYLDLCAPSDREQITNEIRQVIDQQKTDHQISPVRKIYQKKMRTVKRFLTRRFSDGDISSSTNVLNRLFGDEFNCNKINDESRSIISNILSRSCSNGSGIHTTGLDEEFNTKPMQRRLSDFSDEKSNAKYLDVTDKSINKISSILGETKINTSDFVDKRFDINLTNRSEHLNHHNENDQMELDEKSLLMKSRTFNVNSPMDISNVYLKKSPAYTNLFKEANILDVTQHMEMSVCDNDTTANISKLSNIDVEMRTVTPLELNRELQMFETPKTSRKISKVFVNVPEVQNSYSQNYMPNHSSRSRTLQKSNRSTSYYGIQLLEKTSTPISDVRHKRVMPRTNSDQSDEHLKKLQLSPIKITEELESQQRILKNVLVPIEETKHVLIKIMEKSNGACSYIIEDIPKGNGISSKLKIGDELLTIAGRRTMSMSFREIQELLQKSSNHVEILVSRLPNENADSANNSINENLDEKITAEHVVNPTPLTGMKKFMVRRKPKSSVCSASIANPTCSSSLIQKAAGNKVIVQFNNSPGAKPFGFSIGEGSRSNVCSSCKKSIFVSQLRSNSQASDSGLLKVGDEILSVNGVDLHGLSARDAEIIIRRINPGFMDLLVYQKRE